MYIIALYVYAPLKEAKHIYYMLLIKIVLQAHYQICVWLSAHLAPAAAGASRILTRSGMRRAPGLSGAGARGNHSGSSSRSNPAISYAFLRCSGLARR